MLPARLELAQRKRRGILSPLCLPFQDRPEERGRNSPLCHSTQPGWSDRSFAALRRWLKNLNETDRPREVPGRHSGQMIVIFCGRSGTRDVTGSAPLDRVQASAAPGYFLDKTGAPLIFLGGGGVLTNFVYKAKIANHVD